MAFRMPQDSGEATGDAITIVDASCDGDAIVNGEGLRDGNAIVVGESSCN